MSAAEFLDGLDAARAKATPGPWVHEHDDYGDEWWFGGEQHGGQEVVAGHIVTGSDHAADAALIVAAVNALPELIADARKLRALREAVKAAVMEEARHHSPAAAERFRAVLTEDPKESR